jgi:hypothetical protein
VDGRPDLLRRLVPHRPGDPQRCRHTAVHHRDAAPGLAFARPAAGALGNALGLDVERYPQATFKSTAVDLDEDGTGTVTGDFSFHGVTKPVTLEVEQIGVGPDPWGGFRRGFQGSTRFALKDFGIDYDLGPASQVVEIILSIEGVRQDG